MVSAGADQAVTPARDDRFARRARSATTACPRGARRRQPGRSSPARAPSTFANPSSPATTAQLSATGTYVFRLSASDGELQASDDVTVVLEPANPPPVVSAGPDQRVLGLATTLVGLRERRRQAAGRVAQLGLERRERAGRGRASRTRPAPRPA